MPQFRFRALALGSAVLVANALGGWPSIAVAGDVAIDNAVWRTGPDAKVTFKHVDLIDTNLTQDEATKLFNGALDKDAAAALAEKFKAARIVIPEAVVAKSDGATFTLHDIAADNIADGSVGHAALGSAEALLPGDSGDSNLHIGAAHWDKVAFDGLADAIRSGEFFERAVRFEHFDGEGIELSVPDKDLPAGAPGGNRILVKLGATHVDQTLDSTTPLSTVAQFKGLSIEMPKASNSAAMLTALGLAKIEGDLQFSGHFEPAASVYTLEKYSINLQNIGAVGLTGRFGNIDKNAFNGDRETRRARMLDATVDQVELRIINSGLFEKTVAFYSLSQGKTPDQIKAEWRAIVDQAPTLFAGVPAARTLAKALDKFIGEPKNLSIVVKGKDGPIKTSEFMHVDEPTAFLNRLDIAASANQPGVESAGDEINSTPIRSTAIDEKISSSKRITLRRFAICNQHRTSPTEAVRGAKRTSR